MILFGVWMQVLSRRKRGDEKAKGVDDCEMECQHEPVGVDEVFLQHEGNGKRNGTKGNVDS